MARRGVQHVCAVEIGGRAVRLLVVEVFGNDDFKVIHSDWRRVNLAATNKLENSFKPTVNEVVHVVRSFLNKCSDLGVSAIRVFGTGAVRRLPKEYIQYLFEQIPNFMVLDKKSEALCSFVAAVRGLPSVVSDENKVLTIDQGSRSMELALGRLFNNSSNLIDYKSYKLGTQSLMDLLKKNKGNISLFQNKLEQRISYYELFGIGSSPPIIVLGSAVTRFAWIKVCRYPDEKYKLHRVHGQIISLNNIDRFIEAAIANAGETRRIIDSQNASEDEFERVVTGLVSLSIFLRRFKRTRFVVSGLGTRYGLVWLMLQHEFEM